MLGVLGFGSCVIIHRWIGIISVLWKILCVESFTLIRIWFGAEMFYDYFAANKTAGYSGFVVYGAHGKNASCSYWMIPNTFEYDWDNQ
jgi:hypothetical protein